MNPLSSMISFLTFAGNVSPDSVALIAAAAAAKKSSANEKSWKKGTQRSQSNSLTRP